MSEQKKNALNSCDIVEAAQEGIGRPILSDIEFKRLEQLKYLTEQPGWPLLMQRFYERLENNRQKHEDQDGEESLVAKHAVREDKAIISMLRNIVHEFDQEAARRLAGGRDGDGGDGPSRLSPGQGLTRAGL